MANPQITYGPRPVAYEGMLAYGRVRGIEQSRACETAAGINFGRAVSEGSSNEGCILGGSVPIGVSLRDNGQGMDDDSIGKNEYKSMVSVMDKDFVWVETASTTGAYRAPVYYNTTTGVFTVTDSPSGAEKVIGYLGQTLTAAGLIKIYVDTELFYRVSEIEDEVAAAVEGNLDNLTPTAPVTALDAAVGNIQSVVTWVDPVDTDVDHIVVQVSVTSSGVVSSTRNVAKAAQAVTITGLTNGVNYTIAVWVIDTDGNESDIVTDTVTPSA